MSIETPIVAIVDDDASVCTGVQRFLRSAGCCATTFTSGVDFLAAFDTVAPDCVILDVVMPKMTGPEVLARLRARGLGVPVIFISAEDRIDLLSDGGATGHCAFLHKPFDGDRLIALIKAGLGSSVR